MGTRAIALAIAAVGCGRLHFDEAQPMDARLAAPDAPAAAPAFVQIVAPGYSSTTEFGATIVVTAGNLLIVGAYWDEDPDTITLSDSLGLALSGLPAQTLGTVGCGGATGNGTGAQLWYAPITTSGSDTVTIRQDAGVFPLGLFLVEYANVNLGAPIDVMTGQAAPGTTSTMTVPPLATTGNDMIVALFNDTVSTGSMTGAAGYTVEARDTGFPNMIEDRTAPAGTYTPDGTLPGGSMDMCWVGTAVALRGR